VIAARRAAYLDPENSLASIREAIPLGVDIIEIDLKMSAYGVPFLRHDATFNRTVALSMGKIETMNSEDVKLVKLKNTDYSESDQVVPALREALLLLKEKFYVDLDLKTEKIEFIVPIGKELGMLDQVFFFDSDWDVLD
jgi:glycerophosphoryl diester phosphodiesterase